jgi:hypothetical protein
LAVLRSGDLAVRTDAPPEDPIRMKLPWAVLPLACIASLTAACERPGWTDPETSKGPRVPPASAMPARPGLPQVEMAAPPAPAWAAALLGRQLKTAFPGTQTCLGTTDMVELRFLGPPSGSRLIGWGWDVARKEPVKRILIVDDRGQIIAAGEGGEDRPDVPRSVKSINSAKTGWKAVVPLTSGHVEAWGLLADERSVCSLYGVDL